jgi:hypothetical protein
VNQREAYQRASLVVDLHRAGPTVEDAVEKQGLFPLEHRLTVRAVGVVEH